MALHDLANNFSSDASALKCERSLIQSQASQFLSGLSFSFLLYSTYIVDLYIQAAVSSNQEIIFSNYM